MPLYGGDPYYSPDDITQELWTTLEFPAVQSFWQKWRLWLIGTAMVLGATTGTLTGLVASHDCCANTGTTNAPVAPPPVHPAPVTIKTHPPTPAESRTSQ